MGLIGGQEEIESFYGDIKTTLEQFITAAEEIARVNKITESPLTVAKTIEIFVSRPLLDYNIYGQVLEKNRSKEQKHIIGSYQILTRVIGSRYFGKYLQQRDTIEIIDQILKLRKGKKRRGLFLYNKPEKYFFAKCLSLGIKRLRENLGLSYHKIASDIEKSVTFVRNLENCRAGAKNYERDVFSRLIAQLAGNARCTFQFLLLLADDYNKSENGLFCPIQKIDDRRLIELNFIQSFLKENSDIAAALFKIISDWDSKEYIDLLRNVLFDYCEKIDNLNKNK